MKPLNVILVALLSILSLAGCNKNEADNSSNVRGAIRTTEVFGGGNVPANFSYANGSIQGNSSNFTQVVKTFLGGSSDVSQIGQIDAMSGVNFYGMVRVDASGNIIPSSSGVIIQVTDDYTNSGMAPIAPVGIPGSSGRAASGSADITFQDGYGSVRLVGSYDWSYFQGTAYFQNSNGSNGTLGTFRIQTCGFFVCGQ